MRSSACAGDPQDSFLLGVSRDEGKTWTPAVTLRDVVGAKPCGDGAQASGCARTLVWLCENYGVCGPRPVEPEPPSRPAPDACEDASCGDDRHPPGCELRPGRLPGGGALHGSSSSRSPPARGSGARGPS